MIDQLHLVLNSQTGFLLCNWYIEQISCIEKITSDPKARELTIGRFPRLFIYFKRLERPVLTKLSRLFEQEEKIPVFH